MEKYNELEVEFLETIENYIAAGNKLKPYEIEGLMLDVQVKHIEFLLEEAERKLNELLH